MHNTLSIAIFAGLGGMIGWGSADFFAKKTVDKIGPIKSLVWGHGFGTAIFVAIALFQVLVLGHSLHLPTNFSAWLGLLFFGVLQMIVYWLAYQGFEKGQLAVLNPVFASFPGIVAVVAVLFFHEKPTLVLALALIIIFLGNLLLNVDLKELKSKRLNVTPGLKEMVAAALLAAAWTLGWDKFIKGREALSSALFMYAFMSLAAVALARTAKVKLGGVGADLWQFLIFIGLGEALAYLAISWGYSSTPYTSIVALISGAFSVPTIILAYLFLKERLSRLQSAAIGLIILGIVAVAIN